MVDFSASDRPSPNIWWKIKPKRSPDDGKITLQTKNILGFSCYPRRKVSSILPMAIRVVASSESNFSTRLHAWITVP